MQEVVTSNPLSSIQLPVPAIAVPSGAPEISPVTVQQLILLTVVQSVLRELMQDMGPNPMKTLREFIQNEKELTTENNQRMDKAKAHLVFQQNVKQNCESL